MSWDSYIDRLVSSGHVDKAAILGIDDGTAWAQSPTLKITPAEGKALTAGLKNASSLSSSGIVVSATKFFYLQSDDSQIQGKQGTSGISIAKGKKCLVIGIYKDGMAAGNCRKQVESICDYLKNAGY